MRRPFLCRTPNFLIAAGVLALAFAAVPAFCEEGEPTPGFAGRRAAMLDQMALGSDNNAFDALARLETGKPVSDEALSSTIGKMNRRADCADFGLQGLLRVFYQFEDSALLPPELKEEARSSILRFKYWPDEPGIDSMCYWSENHHILFSTGGYLAGQLFPDEIFTNSGRTGREQMDRFRPRVLRWLDFRFRTGFSEWLSNVYYEEDIGALVNLVDFAQDEQISTGAAMVLDLLLADIALNSYRGLFGSTHGRTYERHKKWAASESTAGTYVLLFSGSEGVIPGGGMGAGSLALSTRYRVPRVLFEIANDPERPVMLNRQRAGIKIEDAEKWGLRFDNIEDGMVFLSMEAYAHHKVVNLFMRMLDEYNWWENEFFEPFAKKKTALKIRRSLGILPAFAWLFRHDVTRNLRDEVNIYTYRTPDYMLSSAQDYRRDYGGDQQHIWQASLGPDAVCFTTHPVGGHMKSPGYWTGSGSLPRVAQTGNVAVVLYNIRSRPALYVKNKLKFTHAWLPKDKFDEVVERAPWIFARKSDGYLALCSKNPYTWETKHFRDRGSEIIAEGRRNVWLCELGSKRENGSFDQFMEAITKARLEFGYLSVEYDSPSQGRLEFDWESPLMQNGKAVCLKDYARYDNPYVQAGFPAENVEFKHNGHFLQLNWTEKRREFSR